MMYTVIQSCIKKYLDKEIIIFIKKQGYVRISTLFNQIREEKEEKEDKVTLDNEDTFHGTYLVVETKGRILVPIFIY